MMASGVAVMLEEYVEAVGRVEGLLKDRKDHKKSQM